LAESGATIIFEGHLPTDVPGLGKLDERRKALREVISHFKFEILNATLREAKLGKGRFLVGDLEAALEHARIPRETLVDQGELLFVRRKANGEYRYFICNHGAQPFDGWITPAMPFSNVLLMDPMTGNTGMAATRTNDKGRKQVYLQMPPGGSMILRTDPPAELRKNLWTYWQPDGSPTPLTGTWTVDFLAGGPALPTSFQMEKLASWTERSDDEAKRFAGTARYRITFDAPKSGKQFQLDLGRVCESARILLNGRELGTLIMAPYRVVLGDLRPTGNVLEVEVTNLAANRIRDMDRRGIVWRKFRDANVVNMAYKPFDASTWPIRDSGLLGPVVLQPIHATCP
jgi:hypothetical protein